MASVSPGCSSSEDEEAEEVAPPDRLSLRPVYYYLQAIWTGGSCTPQQLAPGPADYPPHRLELAAQQDAMFAAYPRCGQEVKRLRDQRDLPGG